MAFLQQLQNGAGLPKLKPTTTRITDQTGKIIVETKTSNGSYQIALANTINTVDSKSNTDGVFMVIDNSLDDKVHCVLSDSLYIGSQNSAYNYNELISNSITHIVNVATGITNPFSTSGEFIYYNAPILDIPTANIAKIFVETNEFIHNAIQEKKRVLCHCQAGISRSSTIIIAYLIGKCGYNYDDAYSVVRKARTCIRPNDGFIVQLKQYHKELNEKQQSLIEPVSSG